MKNKSPVISKDKQKQKQAKSPIVKAKDKQAAPNKNMEASPKSPKQKKNKKAQKQNGNAGKGDGIKIKLEKSNKVPVMNEASDDHVVTAAPQEKPKQAKKNKTPPKTTEKEVPVKKAKTTIESPKKKETVKILRKVSKKNKKTKKGKVSLVSTLAELKHNKDVESLREMLPSIIGEIEYLEARLPLSAASKRKLRILKAYRNKAESGNLEYGAVKKSSKNKPQKVLDMSQDIDDEDDNETWVDKINKTMEDENEENNLLVEEKLVEEKPSKGKKLKAVKNAEEKKNNAQKEAKANKKNRYVLFVGNLTYETTEAEIREHFKKVGKIVSVRIGLDKETNASKGFCHLELDCEESYQKALSMHHTQMNKRRINVNVTENKNERSPKGGKNSAKVKDMKMKAMAKKGQLAGSTKDSQKRSARRKKAAAAAAAEDAE